MFVPLMSPRPLCGPSGHRATPCVTSLMVRRARILTYSMSARGHIRSIGPLAYFVVPIWCNAGTNAVFRGVVAGLFFSTRVWMYPRVRISMPCCSVSASVLRDEEPVTHTAHRQNPPGCIRIGLDLEPDSPDVLGDGRATLPLLG
jgi:hypothetical protein